MADMVTIREAVERTKQDGIPVSEYALRLWIRRGEFPVRRAGVKALVFYPALVKFVKGGGNE